MAGSGEIFLLSAHCGTGGREGIQTIQSDKDQTESAKFKSDSVMSILPLTVI